MRPFAELRWTLVVGVTNCLRRFAAVRYRLVYIKPVYTAWSVLRCY